MLYQERAAIDFNWHEIVIEGQNVLCKKWGSKITRKTTLIYQLGSRKPVARTMGTVEVEDMTLEFNYMAGLKFLSIFGVTDFSVIDTQFAGREFEMIDSITDPRPIPSAAGRSTSIYKGCEILSLETTGEAGETPTGLVVTIGAREAIIARGTAGGGASL